MIYDVWLRSVCSCRMMCMLQWVIVHLVRLANVGISAVNHHTNLMPEMCWESVYDSLFDEYCMASVESHNQHEHQPITNNIRKKPTELNSFHSSRIPPTCQPTYVHVCTCARQQKTHNIRRCFGRYQPKRTDSCSAHFPTHRRTLVYISRASHWWYDVVRTRCSMFAIIVRNYYKYRDFRRQTFRSISIGLRSGSNVDQSISSGIRW